MLHNHKKKRKKHFCLFGLAALSLPLRHGWGKWTASYVISAMRSANSRLNIILYGPGCENALPDMGAWCDVTLLRICLDTSPCVLSDYYHADHQLTLDAHAYTGMYIHVLRSSTPPCTRTL